MVIEKKCTGPCGLTKPIEDFGEAYNNIRKKKYRKSKCRECQSDASKVFNAAYRSRASELRRLKRLADPEAARAKDRAEYQKYRDGDLIARKRYYQTNREKILARNAIWREENREHLRARAKEYAARIRSEEELAKDRERSRIARDLLKREVFEYYGKSQCTCCGENNLEMLTLDHINNDGGEHRRQLGPVSTKMYRWAKKQGWPRMFTVLCFNCNLGRHLNGGICPHQQQVSHLRLVV